MRSTLALLALAFMIFSCAGGEQNESTEKVNRSALTQRIDSLEQVFFEGEEEVTEESADSLFTSYKTFITAFPNEDATTEYMFKAAGIARGMDRPEEALKLYKSLLTDYPEFDKKAETRFLIAFVYDSDLQNQDKARSNYKLVQENYPDSPWSEQAKQRLSTLGMTDEQLIEMFEQRQDSAKKSSSE